ncbi:MAG: hypothetical protein JJ866_00695 [Roseibium sp.]|uniref:hypothetical protein n=1 Tax=Roseibium sp. TaxID=1936156 RepID=UPI001B12EFDB|nr:hypothetical protein [Roseibium sp.]MBO6890430.1 hypothetical protein [Roseibium sp.]MBO6931682.1 hypothetical protein [Roseibium sp.]
MRILLVTLLLLIGTTISFACGNPLLWAMLFKKVPEAKAVYEAEMSARSEGLITARVYDAKPGQPYHSWSKAWLLTLAKEMQPAVSDVLHPDETLDILLADEVAVLSFSKNAEPVFISAGGLRNVERYDLITTINALKDAWRTELTYGELVEHALVSGDHEGMAQKLTRIFHVRSGVDLKRSAQNRMPRRL